MQHKDVEIKYLARKIDLPSCTVFREEAVIDQQLFPTKAEGTERGQQVHFIAGNFLHS